MYMFAYVWHSPCGRVSECVSQIPIQSVMVMVMMMTTTMRSAYVLVRWCDDDYYVECCLLRCSQHPQSHIKHNPLRLLFRAATLARKQDGMSLIIGPVISGKAGSQLHGGWCLVGCATRKNLFNSAEWSVANTHTSSPVNWWQPQTFE